MSSFGLLHWVIFAAIAYAVFIAARGIFGSKKGAEMVCLDCGTQARAVRRTKGSLAIEILLWLCFLVPGMIYSIWRLTTRTWACPECGSERLAPPHTPAAKRMLQQQTTPST